MRSDPRGLGWSYGMESGEVEFDEMPPAQDNLERMEIFFLATIGTIATVMNLIVFARLLKQARYRQPTTRASIVAGPYHISSFTLFKLSLCTTDFLILLVHTFGKILWLISTEWPLGDSPTSCKIYKVLSIFSFYANSNVVAAIGLDRLKVVYSSHIQGAASVQRVKYILISAWLLAAVCSIPQLWVWKTVEVHPNWHQCSDVFNIFEHQNASTESTRRLALAYELYHQAAVFWIPFLVICLAYLFIVLKLLPFTLRPVNSAKASRCSATFSFTDNRGPKVYEPLLTANEKNNTATACHTNNNNNTFSPRPKRRCISTQSSPIPRMMAKAMLEESVLGGESHNSSFRSLDYKRCAFSSSPAFYNLNGPLKKAPLPLWRRQLRSRIFVTALLVVLAHVAMWLPYNVLSTLRVVDPSAFSRVPITWVTITEDLIVVNSLLNPILYSWRCF